MIATGASLAGDDPRPTPALRAAVQAPPVMAAPLLRRLDQAAILFSLLVQLVLYVRSASTRSAGQHGQHAVLAALRIVGLAVASCHQRPRSGGEG